MVRNNLTCRLIVRAVLGTLHVAAAISILSFLVLLSGCDDDEDQARGPCGDDDHRYYCMHTVFTPIGDAQPIDDEWSVDDICGEGGNYEFGDHCDATVNGDNVSYACTYRITYEGCSIDHNVDMSGTVSQTAIDLSGTITFETSGDCPPGVGSGSYNVTITGTPVSGPDASCGPNAGGSFTLNVTKPSGTVTIEDDATVCQDQDPYLPHWDLDFLGSGGTSMTHELKLGWAPFDAVPAQFAVDQEILGDGAWITYSELSLNPYYTFMLWPGGGAVSSGVVSITSKTDTHISGTFSITGTGDVTTGGTSYDESRTLTGSFNLPYSDCSSRTAAGVLQAARKRAVQAVIAAQGESRSTSSVDVTTP